MNKYWLETVSDDAAAKLIELQILYRSLYVGDRLYLISITLSLLTPIDSIEKLLTKYEVGMY